MDSLTGRELQPSSKTNNLIITFICSNTFETLKLRVYEEKWQFAHRSSNIFNQAFILKFTLFYQIYCDDLSLMIKIVSLSKYIIYWPELY